MSRQRWIWLGDHLAVDFANTTIGLDDRREELIGSVDEFREWMEAEPAWLPSLDGDRIELARVLEQRDATDRLLRCAALQRPLQPQDVELVNARVRAAGVSRLLTTAPGTSRLAADGGFPALLGVLAAATVDLLARDDIAAIAVCEAPGCGQIFHRSRRNQRWCSPGCGNRARVDRHRHRNPGAGVGRPR